MARTILTAAIIWMAAGISSQAVAQVITDGDGKEIFPTDNNMVFFPQPRQMTLKECIDYARQNSASIAKLHAQAEQKDVDIMQTQAEWLPSVSASTSHSLNYTPFMKEQAGVDVDKTTYNGSYGVNASWTVWNGNQTANNIRAAKLQAEQSKLQEDIAINQIAEQAAQLYIQILYTQEALKVNRDLLEQDQTLYRRGEELLRQGQIAKYELTELKAQVANGEYDVVNTQTLIDQYKLQLKQLIDYPASEPFDIASIELSDQHALADIPSANYVYDRALTSRPEITEANLAIQESEINYSIAKAGYLPTVSLNAGLGTNHSTGSHTDYFEQMKRSFDASVGISISVPILDNRRNKANTQKADINRTIALLDKEQAEEELYHTIANYRLQAANNQQKFKAGLERVEYNQENYNAVYEKSRIGTMNIVEVLNARTNLLNARQDALQSKYLTVYNIEMLHLYAGEEVTL